MRSTYGFVALALALAGCSSLAGAPATAPMTAPDAAPAKGSQDLYIANILGGVPLYSTGKSPREVGDITDELPRVTSVWVDQKGVLYAFSDNRQYPYETIEEFKPRATSPFFSLVLQHYGNFAVADSAQNVYAQGTNSSGKSIIDVYPAGSQSISNEYFVPSIGRISGAEGLAFDSSGALLVGVAALANNKQGEVGQVFRLSAGSSKFVSLKLKKAYGGEIAIDGAGNLYVAGGELVSVYPSGETQPSRVIHVKAEVAALAAATDGTLYVDKVNSAIEVYPPGSDTPTTSFVPEAQVSGLVLGGNSHR
ncbi:MAG TPA: hypothetical protein VGX91_01305 [Candidatus Cybelea sp.]|nr:hypothetical protein [Candidatus Cybelea sp.]